MRNPEQKLNRPFVQNTLLKNNFYVLCHFSGRSTIGIFYKDFQAAINGIVASNDDLETDWSLYQATKIVIYLILSFSMAFLCHF